MTDPDPISPDEIRSRFSRAMSAMYRTEVPHYGTLMRLVAEVNDATLRADPASKARLERVDDLDRIALERHGAIRLGTATELFTMRRLFAVMGMEPVGYYDLSVAGVPVHATAFRPVREESLARNPFRVFTSLLRLDLIADAALRGEAEAILARRQIFAPEALALIARRERDGGLGSDDADAFVRAALETFRWHGEATVDAATYARLTKAHRLVADVVCFKGPHINHLTPRTLDIDAVQAGMPAVGIAAKDVIEGPPARACAILLRQTSFKALDEPILFTGATGAEPGTHTARFGEVEQRGLALTPKGRALYDRLLVGVRDADGAGRDYATRLAEAFAAFPDDEETLRREGLGYFRYALVAGASVPADMTDLEDLLAAGHVTATPLTYEDFLPVSAAGIFQSNLGGDAPRTYAADANQAAFEAALGVSVLDETALYAGTEARSIAAVRAAIAAQHRRAAA